MTGRERELQELDVILSRTRAGEGGLLLLAGEAGVGKTRLAMAAIAAAQLASLRSAAAEHGGSPYAPIAAVLREFLRREPAGLSTAEPLFAHLGVLLPELGPAPAVTDRETLFEAVRGAFDTIAAREATVVFLDDLQWADSATLELLPSLAEAAEEWPLLVLGAYRKEIRAAIRCGGSGSTSDVQGGSRSSAWSRSIRTGPLGSRRRSSAASRARRCARRSTTARRECRSSWRSSRRRCEPAAGSRRGRTAWSSSEVLAFRSRRPFETRYASEPRACRTRDEPLSRLPV